MTREISPWLDWSGTSKLVLVGEAPGSQEVRFGRPFVGPSGEILNGALSLPRSEVDIINVFPELVSKPRTGTSWTMNGTVVWNGKFTDAAAPHVERLRVKLAEHPANLIVCIGGVAMEAVMGFKASEIGKRRGSIYCYGDPPRKMMATYHPAACLHGMPEVENLIYTDLAKARAECKYPEVRALARNIKLRPTAEEAVYYLRSIRGRVAFDVETFGRAISCIGVARSATDAMVIPFAGEEGYSYYSEADELDIVTALADLIGNPDVAKMNQNIKYDLRALIGTWNILPRGRIDDIMILHHLMMSGYPDNLGFIASLHSDMPYWKDEYVEWIRIQDFERFWTYCAKDALVVWDCWQAMSQGITDQKLWQTYENTTSMIPIALMMTLYGHAVSAERLKSETARIDAEIKTLAAKLPPGLNLKSVNSSKQLTTYFYGPKTEGGLGIRPYIGASGNPTVDDHALSSLARIHKCETAKLIRELRNLLTYKTRYLKTRLDHGRLICDINLVGTRFGRWSSSEDIFTGTGTNMQNLDPRFCNFIEAD